MDIRKKLLFDINDIKKYGAINIVIFGDSVSHGAISGYNDYDNVYWNRLRRKFNEYRDTVPVNMINSAIGGTTSTESVARIESQILKHEPDMVIVCFGLNEVNRPLEDFMTSLKTIFSKCMAAGAEVIYMTPNMLNTYVAEGTREMHLEYAAKMAHCQTSGIMDNYIYSAINLAKEMGVAVCDCYSEWKKLAETEDTTQLLANKINHPIPEMHGLFADKLYELIMGDAAAANEGSSTMFNGK